MLGVNEKAPTGHVQPRTGKCPSVCLVQQEERGEQSPPGIPPVPCPAGGQRLGGGAGGVVVIFVRCWGCCEAVAVLVTFQNPYSSDQCDR